MARIRRQNNGMQTRVLCVKTGMNDKSRMLLVVGTYVVLEAVQCKRLALFKTIIDSDEHINRFDWTVVLSFICTHHPKSGTVDQLCIMMECETQVIQESTMYRHDIEIQN